MGKDEYNEFIRVMITVKRDDKGVGNRIMIIRQTRTCMARDSHSTVGQITPRGLYAPRRS